MEVTKLDHLVLTVRDIEETKVFYETVLGMEVIVFGEGRVALRFGNQKINLHEVGKEFDPKAQRPIPFKVVGLKLSKAQLAALELVALCCRSTSETQAAILSRWQMRYKPHNNSIKSAPSGLGPRLRSAAYANR